MFIVYGVCDVPEFQYTKFGFGLHCEGVWYIFGDVVLFFFRDLLIWLKSAYRIIENDSAIKYKFNDLFAL